MDLRLQRDGLVLRPPRRHDAAAMVEAVRESQPEIGRYLVWATADYGIKDAEHWCKSATASAASPEGPTALHVFDEAGGLLGGVGLHAQDLRNGKVELGYWTRASCRGQAVAVRAARLMSGCAFDAMGFSRVELIIATDNVASVRVAEKLGAEPEATLKDRLRLDHGLVDAYLYALLKRTTPR